MWSNWKIRTLSKFIRLASISWSQLCLL